MNSEIEMVEVENYDWVVELGKKEFVDLGFSVKWANVNVGAKCPNDKGKYFAWDEVELDEKGRMPSENEIKELLEKCTWTWVNKDGIAGYEVKSRENENKIFLPVGGLMIGDKVQFAGEMGYYLSSSCKENGACELLFSNKFRGMYLAGSYKRSVRLVSDK